jgi:hypothetical protein
MCDYKKGTTSYRQQIDKTISGSYLYIQIFLHQYARRVKGKKGIMLSSDVSQQQSRFYILGVY